MKKLDPNVEVFALNLLILYTMLCPKQTLKLILVDYAWILVHILIAQINSSYTKTSRRGRRRGSTFFSLICFILILILHMVALYVVLFYFAIMASRTRKNQPGNRPDFPWYSFPRIVGPEVLVQWNG